MVWLLTSPFLVARLCSVSRVLRFLPVSPMYKKPGSRSIWSCILLPVCPPVCLCPRDYKFSKIVFPNCLVLAAFTWRDNWTNPCIPQTNFVYMPLSVSLNYYDLSHLCLVASSPQCHINWYNYVTTMYMWRSSLWYQLKPKAFTVT